MFTAGLRILAPKQFTVFAVRPALKNPKCTLALHHHLRYLAHIPLLGRDSPDKRVTSTGV